MGEEDSSSAFKEVRQGGSRWKNNKNKNASSAAAAASTTPVPTYQPTTPWPTYVPTTQEELAQWLKKKQKYLKNRDKVPDNVWEADEASASKKKQLLWLEKEKEKKKSDKEEEEEEEVVGKETKDGKHNEDDKRDDTKELTKVDGTTTSPTPTPTYYDPQLVPTRKQNLLDKREKVADQKQNKTNNEDGNDSFTPTQGHALLLNNLTTTNAPSYGGPKIEPMMNEAPTVQLAPQLPTRKQIQADKRAELAAQKLSNNTASKAHESTTPPTNGRGYDGSSRTPPKSRNPEKTTETIQEMKKTKGGSETVSTTLEGVIEEAEPESVESKKKKKKDDEEEPIEEAEPESVESKKKNKKDDEEEHPKTNNNERNPPASRSHSDNGDANDTTSDEAKEESEPEMLEVKKDKGSKPKNSDSQKVSLTFPVDGDESSSARDASKPSPKPIKPTTTVKVNLSFNIPNKTKKATGPPVMPSVTSSEPTYIVFPTVSPTEPHPTYAPTSMLTMNKKKSTKDTSLYDKRTCPDENNFFVESQSQSSATAEKGYSVFFTYGIQTGKDVDIEEAVEKIQLWLLEDVASKLLHCKSATGISSVMMDKVFRNDRQDGVLSSVYYSKDDDQYANECIPTISEAQMCAVISSTMRFDAVNVHEEQARPKVLAVIYNQLSSGYDTRLGKENVFDLAYLGPELGYHQPELKDTPASSPTTTRLVAVIGVASTAAFALLLCLATRYKLLKERRRRMPSVTASSSYRYRDSVVPHYHDAGRDDHYSYPSSDLRSRSSSCYYRQNS